MIAACTGLDQFRDRRDEALIRFMVETGCRAGEVAVMQLSDSPDAVPAVVGGPGGGDDRLPARRGRRSRRPDAGTS